MTKARLEQYRSFLKEEAELKEELAKLEACDVVQGSDSRYPYIKHSIKIGGNLSNESADYLKKRIDEIKKERKAIRKWIDNIKISEIRRIFKFRYIEGLSWLQIATKMEVSGDGSTERKKHDRFLKTKNEVKGSDKDG